MTSMQLTAIGGPYLKPWLLDTNGRQLSFASEDMNQYT